jgi:hypothetical protein
MKLIGKLAVIAATTLATATVSGIVAVKKTERGAKAWKAVEEFATKQTEKAQAKLKDLKAQAEAKGEAKAIVEVLMTDKEMREEMKARVAAIIAAQKELDKAAK